MTNGTPCLIKHINIPDSSSYAQGIVWVQFDDKSVGSMTRNENCHLYRNKANICKEWTPIKHLDRSFSVSRFHTVNRWQFPLRLAGAKTFHRVQGDTTDAAVCDFSGKCGNGLVYMGLCHCRSIERLYVKSFNEKKIHVDQWVHEEMLRLENRMIHLFLKLMQIKDSM